METEAIIVISKFIDVGAVPEVKGVGLMMGIVFTAIGVALWGFKGR